jgi:ATP-binding cassette, subfamily B, bacterial
MAPVSPNTESTAIAKPGDKVSWRTRLLALRNVLPMLRLLWETSPLLVLCTATLRICRSLLPVTGLWISKLIMDAIVARIMHRGGDAMHIWKLVALQVLFAVGTDLLGRAQSLTESVLADRFGKNISLRIMEHATRLDLACFEDHAFTDKLQRARGQTGRRLDMLTSVLDICQDVVSLASLSLGLVVFSPWLMVLLLIAVIPAFLGEAHFSRLSYSIMYRRTPERRFLEYLLTLTTSPQSAKEIKIFGLGKFLCGRYEQISDSAITENTAVAKKKAVAGFLLGMVSTTGYYGAYAFVLARTITGGITVGTFTFLSGAFMRSHSSIQHILSSFNDVAEQALYLKDLFEFFETEPTIRSLPTALPAPRPLREGFRFENVGFAYPGSDHWVVRNLNLELRRGEKIALIGRNGAGKTTLVKLMARLYDPTEGRIFLDGIDLREYDFEDLLQEVGVIFQDYMRYDFPVRENIGVGKIDSIEEVFRIESAAIKSMAYEVIQRLPNGFDQMVGRRFEGGVDLSGGEWQKLALARAYMRDAQILILDEPTASLDAQAEHEIFKRFAELTQGRLTVFISHRFSTVRMADRILVLDNGIIREHGTHEQLVAMGGQYAHLFHLQAAGYR